jgi:hypothetical protein
MKISDCLRYDCANGKENFDTAFYSVKASIGQLERLRPEEAIRNIAPESFIINF